MNLLIPNLGSTSLKYQVLEMPSETVRAKGRVERVRDYREAIAQISTGEAPIDAIALKAVHAGPQYRGTFLVDDGVVEATAPVSARRAGAQRHLPDRHRSVPRGHARRADRGRLRAGVPRHHAGARAAVRRPPLLAGRGRRPSTAFMAPRTNTSPGGWRKCWAARCRLVSCHLGGSSSMCAIDGGRSVDTTMGFSPQSGLENATRHGDLDVFAVLYMMERHGWGPEEVRRQLADRRRPGRAFRRAGGDVRDLEAAAAQGNRRAEQALEVFVYQVKKTIGAYAAAMGGLDAVAFTGGIGENSARLRAACCAGLEFLGIRIDPARNESGSGDRLVSADSSAVAVLALSTNEELIVARRAYRLLNHSAGQIAKYVVS